jgi:hypothetical protein
MITYPTVLKPTIFSPFNSTRTQKFPSRQTSAGLEEAAAGLEEAALVVEAAATSVAVLVAVLATASKPLTLQILNQVFNPFN